jgi:Flp pilus assembly protein TadB
VRRRLQWEKPREEPRREHPYRDTALVYLGFAVVIVLLAIATGGSLGSAIAIAALFWLAATTYSALRLRRKRKLR